MSTGPDQQVNFGAALDKPWWRKPTNILPLMSLLVSAAALLIAIRSSLIAGQSLELSAREFVAQRQPIWVATPDQKAETLAIKPLDSTMALQSARVIYPAEISTREWEVLPPEFRLHLISPQVDLARALTKRLPPKTGYAQVALGAYLPVIISAHYAVRGEGFSDRSIYALTYDFVIKGDNPYDPVSVTFTGMEFDRRLEPGEDDRKTLEALWSTIFQSPKPQSQAKARKGA